MDYIRTLFAPETPAMQHARDAMTDPNDQISVMAEEGKLLQLLIRMNNIRRIVEIGTLGGYAALWMADALQDGGEIITIEKDSARASRAALNTAHDPRIRLLTGDAKDILPTLSGSFDMVFIDADKISYPHYLDWAEAHVRTGGLIIGDNSLLFDSVWHDQPVERVRPTARDAMRTFNRRLADPARYQSILLPTGEGMTIGLKLF
jgi:predicted O-methyltransferase YrrM